MSNELEDPLALPDEAELARIESVRVQVRVERGDTFFDTLPDDFCDDVQIARFLRGHDNDIEKAAHLLAESIIYRKDLVQNKDIQAMREATAHLDLPDLSLLPNSASMLNINPLFIVGSSIRGLPMMVTCPRLLNFDLLDEVVANRFSEYQMFLSGMLEQRALILHKLSHKQGQMVKFIDVRDLNQVSVTKLLAGALSFAGKLKEFLGTVQSFYPEILHQVLCLNSPSGMAPLFNLLSTILNARMMAKIKIYPVGLDFHHIASIFHSRAISNWINAVAGRLCWDSIDLPCGTQEYCARWLEEGTICKWSLQLHSGGDIKLIRVFFPDFAREGVDVEERTFEGDGLCSPGEFEAKTAGVLMLCLCNAEAWWTNKNCTLTIDGNAVGLPPSLVVSHAGYGGPVDSSPDLAVGSGGAFF